MKKLFMAVCITFILLTSGCGWNARMAGLQSYGVDHTVQLYSGGKLVREWCSDGKVVSEEQSDGYFFKDKVTGKLVRVTGDLVITPGS